ncbi:MAG: hypothetical protein K2N56_05765 [Oscillospiraceae bacterium]|nr:hypothetical protein [Oscillospiraceae bacterium]
MKIKPRSRRNTAYTARRDHISEAWGAGSAVKIRAKIKALAAVIKTHNHNDFYSALNNEMQLRPIQQFLGNDSFHGKACHGFNSR